MFQDEIELARVFADGAGRAIDDLIARLMQDEDPALAKEMLLFLARRYPEGSPHALTALTCYQGMRASLSGAGPRRKLSRQYCFYRDLFELEIAATRRQKTHIMALTRDWSRLGIHTRSSLRLAGCRVMLRAAGFMYRFGLASALTCCDAAAFELFRAAYRSS